MKRFPLLCVATLLGVVVPATAQQISFEGRIGRSLVGQVVVDHGHHGPARPRPAVRSRAPAPRGHWQTIHEQVLVPGYWHEEHVPPTFGWRRDACGRLHWGVVDPGGCRRVWVPARWETRSRRVWVAC